MGAIASLLAIPRIIQPGKSKLPSLRAIQSGKSMLGFKHSCPWKLLLFRFTREVCTIYESDSFRMEAFRNRH